MKNKIVLIFLISIQFISFAQNPGGHSSNLTVWYKADNNVSVDGSNNLTAWNASAGGVNVTTINSDPQLVEASVNFNPTIHFDGDDYLYVNAILGSTVISNEENSCFIVFANPTLGGAGKVIAKWEQATAGTLNRLSTEITSDKFRVDFPNSSGSPSGQNKGVTDLSATKAYIGNGLTTSVNDSSYLNGVFENVNTNAGVADNTQSGRFVIGANVGGAFSYTGNIAEIIFYKEKVGDVARQKIQSYLAVKYGSTLGSTSNLVDYVNSSNTTIWTGDAVYQNNVAGIGRDDNSALNQKQSQSHGNGMMTMAILPAGSGNTIPTTNVGNANTFSANNTFLMWGENDASIQANDNETTLPATIQRISQKIWKTQLTGTGLAGKNVRVRVDMSSLPFVVTDYTNYRLILDADADFTSGATLVSPVIGDNASKILEFDVVMSDYANFFVTIGTIQKNDAPLPLDFLSFDVVTKQQKNVLNWTTINERNMEKFEIERSFDLKNWQKIGEQKINNLTYEVNSYQFNDDFIFHQNMYYRIKQMDINGDIQYSVIRTVYNGEPKLDIYPNPTKTLFSINNNGKEVIEYIVFNNKGQKITEGKVLPFKKNVLFVQDWNNGLYLIQYQSKKYINTEKIVVNK